LTGTHNVANKDKKINADLTFSNIRAFFGECLKYRRESRRSGLSALPDHRKQPSGSAELFLFDAVREEKVCMQNSTKRCGENIFRRYAATDELIAVRPMEID
jgi:hypothetical protein